MKKQFLALLLVLSMIFMAAACSASNDSAPKATGQYGYSQTEENADSAAKAAEDKDFQRKVIKNGSLELEAEDVEKAYANILAYAEQNGGYEFKHTLTTRGNYITITAQIKIAPDKLDVLMHYAGDAAGIINSGTTSEDITGDYYDAEVRLKTMKATLEQYYKFLQEARTIDETLRIQTEINSLTEEIEALEGKIKLWDTLTEESTLDLSISQINDPLKPQEDIQWNALTWHDMGLLIKNGFIGVTSVVVSVLQWILIVLVSASPILVPAAVIIVLLVIRHKRKKRQAEK